jgi:hypothetical protein
MEEGVGDYPGESAICLTSNKYILQCDESGDNKRNLNRAQRLDGREIAEALLVARGHPLALGNEGGGLLVDLGLGGGNLVDSEVLEGTGSLDVLQGLLQVGELGLDLALGGLGVLNSLGLEGVNGLELAGNVVGSGLEGLEVVLDLVDDSLVLQDTAVVGEIDGLGLLGKDLDLAAGVIVALLE